MGFLAPLALTFAALGVPILILYMLKLRRQDVLVSSTLLWQRLLRDREANRPWQRLRRNLLLLLQLLVLSMLVLALARPFLPTPSIASGSVVILLDASASMQAVDVAPSRFEAARGIARELIEGLGAGESGTLIIVGPHPAALATGDRAVLRRALDQATPSGGPANWEAAAALAAGALRASGGETVILSDGATDGALPALPGPVHFIRVGEHGDNLAITALAVREGSSGPQAYLRAANFGAAPAQVQVAFRASGRLFDVRSLSLPAGGNCGLILDDLPYDLVELEARLESDDPLPLDDIAWAVRGPAAERDVLLVTPGNLFLERALAILPEINLTRLAPGQPLPAEPYDLIVHDGILTGTLPAGNVWLLGAYGEATTDIFTTTRITRARTDHPLLRHVDLSDVHVLQAWRVTPPPGAQVLIEAEGGSLLFVAERPEGRLAILPFDLHDSDLPLQVAFPILTANLTNWLLGHSRSGETVALQPGAALPLPSLPEAERIVVQAPDGTQRTLPIEENVPIYGDTDQLGVYLATHIGADEAVLRTDRFAVNLSDAQESDITPQAALQVGQTEVAVSTRQAEGKQELWPWLAGMALAMLGAEWWVYQQGTRPVFVR